MFPLFLDLTGKSVVVVGGGPVGRRKSRAARDAGAHVRIVDPKGRAADFLDDAGLSWIAEPYHIRHLVGVVLVFAAATPTVNQQVVADAHARGLWVNSASDPAAGDFSMPAAIRRGGLTIAVGTGGAAPALARRIRKKLEAEFDTAFTDWVVLLEEMRKRVLETVPDADTRHSLLDGFADWPWLAQLRSEGPDAVRTAMLRQLTESNAE